MVSIDDVVHVLPLVSAILWAFIGIGASGRYGVTSPFVRALTLFCLLVSAGCLLDWYLMTFVHASDPALAYAVVELRTSLLAIASLVILLASKWISRGHSWYDPLLALPVAGSVGLIWTVMMTSVRQASWGPEFGRNASAYGLFVVQEVAYYLVAIAFAVSLIRGRSDLPRRLRRPALLSVGSLVVLVGLWIPTNVYTNLVRSDAPPLFSSVAFIPAAMVAVAFMGRTVDEMGEIFRAVSAVERRVSALYVFYKSGEPLVAVGTSRSLPIEAEQLQGVLEIVGNFVETSMKGYHGYSVTAMHFDRLGIMAVRGQYTIVAAVYEGAAYDALRSELLRELRDFESRRWDQLQSWESASSIAEEVADDLAALLRKPTETR